MWKFLAPSGVTAIIAFAVLRRKWEALFFALSMLATWLLTWGLKTAVGRERPALWEMQPHGDDSFPSGHTVDTTCFATALVICVSRIWPRATKVATVVACLWSALVAISRMALGAHWPTDVMAAACIGLIVPFVIQLVLHRASR